MLRYREALGLLPPVGRGPGHRQFRDQDMAAVALALDLERRLDISPAALAFGLRVLAEPGSGPRLPSWAGGSGGSRRQGARWTSRRSGPCGCSAWASGPLPTDPHPLSRP